MVDVFFQIIQHITAFLSMHHSSPFRAETVSGGTLALQVKHFRIFKPRHNRFDDHEIFINRILEIRSVLVTESTSTSEAIERIASEDLWETHRW